MEVILHGIRVLLGNKVIRLRHLKHSLQQLYLLIKREVDLKHNDRILHKEDAHLMMSHSSSGFSSTDL